MTLRAHLECRWERDMERRFDVMPPWWWSASERRRRRDAWVADRLTTQAGDGSAPDPSPRSHDTGETP